MRSTNFRFSTSTMIGYTSAIGFGLCACRVHPTMLHFFLGVLTFFIGFGLIQQLFRRDHWGRKTLLVWLLSSLAFSIYRAHVPYQYDQLAWGEDEAGIGSLESAVAVSFWILTLMLGSFFFWYGTWSSRWDWLLDTTGLLVEHMFYTAEWLFLFVLIPIGIGLVWRRRQVARLSRGDGAQSGAESTVTRWPQIERHQIAAFPFVLLLLVLLITLSIPFGIASFHVGL